jgi:hypothetical protein
MWRPCLAEMCWKLNHRFLWRMIWHLALWVSVKSQFWSPVNHVFIAVVGCQRSRHWLLYRYCVVLCCSEQENWLWCLQPLAACSSFFSLLPYPAFLIEVCDQCQELHLHCSGFVVFGKNCACTEIFVFWSSRILKKLYNTTSKRQLVSDSKRSYRSLHISYSVSCMFTLKWYT